jgi:hypothetical protein
LRISGELHATVLRKIRWLTRLHNESSKSV